MKKIILFLSAILLIFSVSNGQTKQASHSASLIKGARTVNLINGLNITVEFNPDKETLWITGSTTKAELFITEFIPLKDPQGTKIEIGKSYKLDNLFASVEYKILEIKGNRVTRIWFRIAATSLSLPDESWI